MAARLARVYVTRLLSPRLTPIGGSGGREVGLALARTDGACKAGCETCLTRGLPSSLLHRSLPVGT